MRQSMFLTILACFLEAWRRPGIFNSFRSYSYETEHVSYDLGLLLGGVAQAGIFNSFRSYSYETKPVSYDLGLLLEGVTQAGDF